MIMSVDTEKASDRIQYQFVIKILHKMGIEGTYLNIKRPYMISPELTLYSGVKSWKHFLWDLKQDKNAHTLLLFNTVLEVLTTEIRQEQQQQKKGI